MPMRAGTFSFNHDVGKFQKIERSGTASFYGCFQTPSRTHGIARWPPFYVKFFLFTLSFCYAFFQWQENLVLTTVAIRWSEP